MVVVIIVLVLLVKLSGGGGRGVLVMFVVVFGGRLGITSMTNFPCYCICSEEERSVIVRRSEKVQTV